MRIERVQVEEGFLDGLDVSFVPGLNVIVGERGTGKTSLIELIRFCLGVQGYTAESAKRSSDHALSVLESGQVTVTLTDGERKVLVARAADDESPRASETYTWPFIFSQTEIEGVGLQAQGRIRLIDSFSRDQQQTEARESEAASEVRSRTAELETLRREIDELADQVNKIPVLNREIADLEPREKALAKVSADAKSKKDRLDLISENIALSAVGIGAIERCLSSVSRWQSSLSSLSAAPPSLERSLNLAGADPLLACRASLDRARDHLNKALHELEGAVAELQANLGSAKREKLNSEERARQLRIEIERLQQGAGTIVRQGQQLRERKAHLESLKEVLVDRQRAFKVSIGQRNDALDRLDSIREKRFKTRNSVAAAMSETLGPRIRVEVSRAGQVEVFAAAIADLLRGSGLHYSELSSTLAVNLHPRELLEATDRNDFNLVAGATGITKNRAERVLGHLREADLGAIATVAVEDAVSFQLLDGADYKSISELSTGQRCTVVLPLVLRHTDRVLIVDQPEDHIDNAFIVETLIASILAREADSQLILSTHNANIPVLGNARRVIQLGSDGRRGFPVLASTLDDPKVVAAISTVMEGGEEAFRRRATFYSQHLVS